MSETKHTPGPWEVAGITVIQAVAPHDDICDCFDKLRQTVSIGVAEAFANACLIATAPELLEALNRMLSHFSGDEEVCIECGGQNEGCDTCYVIGKAREAVQKATEKARKP